MLYEMPFLAKEKRPTTIDFSPCKFLEPYAHSAEGKFVCWSERVRFVSSCIGFIVGIGEWKERAKEGERARKWLYAFMWDFYRSYGSSHHWLVHSHHKTFRMRNNHMDCFEANANTHEKPNRIECVARMQRHGLHARTFEPPSNLYSKS